MATAPFTIKAPKAFVPIGEIELAGKKVRIPLNEEWLRYLTTQILQAIAAAAAGGDQTVIVGEIDGAPLGAVTTILFPNGTLSIVDGVATYTPAGGGGGSGTVTDFIFTNSTGITGTVNTSTTTPTLSLVLKALGIGITDAGNYYAATDVEGALQEIGGLDTGIRHRIYGGI